MIDRLIELSARHRGTVIGVVLAIALWGAWSIRQIPIDAFPDLSDTQLILYSRWDRSADLKSITVPTLVIGAKYDTMDPDHMKWMAGQLPKGRFLLCPNGSHMAAYDDQQTYFTGLIQFIRDVAQGRS